MDKYNIEQIYNIFSENPNFKTFLDENSGKTTAEILEKYNISYDFFLKFYQMFT